VNVRVNAKACGTDVLWRAGDCFGKNGSGRATALAGKSCASAGCDERLADPVVQGTNFVASAANTIPAPESSAGAGASNSIRANPIAQEVSVIATGTRPSDTGQRDLFTEETSTVLLFKDGAVIRLSAGVALGQLVFLTNKQTKREVVCQVLRKRAFAPTSSYVELDFTEEIPDFWGVVFPAAEEVAAVAPSMALATAAKEMVTSAEPNADDDGAQVEAPSEQEVDHLRKEVEALRGQLQSLLEAKEGTGKVAQAEIVTSPASPLPVPTETPAWVRVVTDAVLSKAVKEEAPPELMKTTDPAPVVKLEAGVSSDHPATHRQEWRMGHPAEARFVAEEEAIAEGEKRSIEALLPKPALDFTNMPKEANSDSVGVLNAGGVAEGTSASGGAVRAVLLAVLLVAFGAGAWYENWLPFLPRTVLSVPRVQAEKTAGAARAAAAVGTTASATTPAKADGAAANSALSGTDGSSEGGKSGSAVAGSGNNADSAAAKDAAERVRTDGNGSSMKRAKELTSAAGAGGKKSSREEVRAAQDEAAADAAVNEGSLVPAKLLKSVNAVYPPDAMRNYITGDVIVDAVVEANGRVGEMKVLTGPAALRPAALDALKEYRYAAATQGGKAVASRVKVAVKFWYNP
jgi:TonB family protein